MATVLLQSKDHGELLDVIDNLRSQGLSSYVALPQIVVCGDQSAGKSSVLEAISGIAFPTKDNLCTRFATELILRRGVESGITVTIIPDGDRSNEQKERLRNFKAPTSDLDGFSALVDAAKEAMGLNHSTKAFSKDILRVEVSGPDQPHLTLVDLPGLIHAESKQQSAEDVELVASLVKNYMSNQRSVILAVVSAKNDYANQVVTKLARDVDPRGLRTLGIITKPDTLHVGSESEEAFVNLARNDEVHFRLGWHVLRNRDFDTKHWTREERDNKEQEFFLNGVWQTLPLDMLGVGTLRPRLSNVLKEQIVAELPNLIRDVEAGVADCQRTMRRLGEARGTVYEQRLYLVRVSQAFSSLLHSATNGSYEQEFFEDARTDAGFKKRLRAVVQDLLLNFAEAMRVEGHFQHIVDDGNDSDQIEHPQKILRSKFIEGVAELIRRTRGREIPGTFNPMIMADLFYHQSQPWPQLVQHYSGQLVAAARAAVELILAYTADTATSESLLHEIVNPALERCVEQLRTKTEEILRPHQRGHPITYNRYFVDTIQRARKEYMNKEQRNILYSFFRVRQDAGSHIHSSPFDVERLLEALNVPFETHMDHFACSEATFCMEAYYQVALKTVVDNFSVLGIEFCLLEGLTHAFAPETVMRLSDGVVQAIAAESEASTMERHRTTEKSRILEDGLHILNRYRRHSQKEPDLTLAPIHTDNNIHQKTGDESPVTNGAQENIIEEPRVPEVTKQELSPFSGSGNFREDGSWLDDYRTLKTKKAKKKKAVVLDDGGT